MSREQRVTDRLARRLTVRYGPDGTDKVSFTRNLSPGGLFIQTNVPFRPGIRLQIELTVPGRTFRLEGIVAWAKRVPPNLAHFLPCGMGVRLIDPPQELTSYCETSDHV